MNIKTTLSVFSFSLFMFIVLAACQEEDDLSAQQALINEAMAEMQTAYDQAKSHHDSLMMYQHDSMMMQDSLHSEDMAQHCDDIFHQQDSLFAQHYDICQSLMSNSDDQTGSMMGDGMMGNGMMRGGMMGSGMMMNDMQMSMDSLEQQHEAYCLRQ